MTQQGPLFPSGSVSAATGTSPITINGLSGFPETGAITIGISSSGFVNALTATAPLTANGASGSPQDGSVTIALTTPLSPANGGTGVDNGTKTIDLSNPVVDYVLTSDSSGNAKWQPSGMAGSVTSITGTPNEIIVSSPTGAVTLSTPQDIATSSKVQFGGIGIGVAASGIAGNLKCSTIQMTFSPVNGYVLTSDATGNASWQPNTAAGGVTSITGTAHQVIASASTGAVTLSTPQGIDTSSDVQFHSIGVGTAATGTIGKIKCDSIQITASPVDGYILTCDASGNGTWQPDGSTVGVTSIAGTANQITASAATGAVTLSLPNGLSVGSYQATSPPSGGIICPGNIGIGTSAPDSTAVLEAAKNGNAYIFSTSYGTNIGGQLILRGARGTMASPTQPLLNDIMGTVACRGYTGAAWSTVNAAGFVFVNGQNGFSTSSQAMSIIAFTTDQGSITPLTCCEFTFTGDVLIGKQSITSSSIGGFAWIPCASGAPTGIPGNYAGFAALYYDLLNHKFWVWDPGAGAWRGVVVS